VPQGAGLGCKFRPDLAGFAVFFAQASGRGTRFGVKRLSAQLPPSKCSKFNINSSKSATSFTFLAAPLLPAHTLTAAAMASL
jgi:hypothetical protein